MIENVDVVTVLDNEALFDINNRNLKILKPTYGDLNHIAALNMSGVTSSMRFPS